MNEQEIFNKVAEHLLTQNESAVVYRASQLKHCVYRTKEGLKCAIGCLIPDEVYTDSIEGQAIGDFRSEPEFWEAIWPGGWTQEREEFLTELQNIHDDTPTRSWPRGLRDFAKRRKLDDGIVQTTVDKLAAT